MLVKLGGLSNSFDYHRAHYMKQWNFSIKSLLFLIPKFKDNCFIFRASHSILHFKVQSSE